jgi:cbb3-type cytochrome oxidase subunit 3
LLESGSRIAVFSAVASAGIEEGGLLSIFGIEDTTAALIGKTFLALVLGLILLLVVYIVYKRRQIRKKKEARALRLRQKQAQEEARRLEWERHYESRHWDNR